MKFCPIRSEFFKGILSMSFVAIGLGLLPCAAQDREKPKPSLVEPPALPVVRSPIERFREMLSLSPAERENALAEKTPEQRKVLNAKLKEYELMTADERELRLAVTELRWYLVPLLRTAPSDRGSLLNSVPAEKRTLVEDRLRRWDTLTGSQQKEFLESEMTVNYFLRLQSSTPEQQTNFMDTFPAAYRQQMEKELAHWRSLPADQRDRMSSRFQQFFELNPDEKEKALGALSESDRVKMEQTLQTFQKLPAEQRRHCIRSFSKFANMSSGERHQFLRKAELWRGMTPSDRDAWRELVQRLPQMPPLPPGLKLTHPFPPDPRATINRASKSVE